MIPGNFPKLEVADFDKFVSHPWIKKMLDRFEKDFVVAQRAAIIVSEDLQKLNESHAKTNGQAIFTSVTSRAKFKKSFLRKLQKLCKECDASIFVNESTIEQLYYDIKDLCGVRFCCAYFDEVEDVIANLVRPELRKLEYVVDLRSEPRYQDKNNLEDGDELGYRSYHFFIKVPVTIDIFGCKEPFLCEVQARTELQNVWAVRSHDLIYKNESPIPDEIKTDMRQLNNELRAIDHFFVRIRKSITKL